MVTTERSDLCNWIKDTHPYIYNSQMKLQAFQLFYNCFLAIDDTVKNRSTKCEFLVNTLSEQDLSELVQHMHTWNNK